MASAWLASTRAVVRSGRTVLSGERWSAADGAALLCGDVSGRCVDVICTETWRRRSSADRRRVSLMTSTFSTRMTSGTTPNNSSSVTHDHTDHSDALPPSVTSQTDRQTDSTHQRVTLSSTSARYKHQSFWAAFLRASLLTYYLRRN